jgi:hypothetical protein
MIISTVYYVVTNDGIAGSSRPFTNGKTAEYVCKRYNRHYPNSDAHVVICQCHTVGMAKFSNDGQATKGLLPLLQTLKGEHMAKGGDGK